MNRVQCLDCKRFIVGTEDDITLLYNHRSKPFFIDEDSGEIVRNRCFKPGLNTEKAVKYLKSEAVFMAEGVSVTELVLPEGQPWHDAIWTVIILKK